MLSGDSRGQWDDHLLNDPRVTHLWDEERVTGRWFGAHGGSRPIEYDAYFLYDRGATWEEEPTKLLGKGRTVIGHSDDLKREIAPYLG
jgi:hypothetical protein